MVVDDTIFNVEAFEVFFEDFAEQVDLVCFYNGYDSIDYIKSN